MGNYSVVGKPLPNIDAVTKVTGEAEYTADIRLPGTLFGKILHSPYPHARIVNIDTSKAERLLGVKAVVTGRDTPGLSFGEHPDQPWTFCDKLPLAIDRARFIGDEVAAVAAIDEDVAEEALGLIQVEYEELPAVFDPEEAMRPGAPDIPGKGSNIGWELHHHLGDVEKGFAESDHIREDRFRTSAQQHGALETHNCLATVDASGQITIWSSCQGAPRIAHVISQLFKVPVSKVRLIIPAIGGGFGGKIGPYSHHYCAVLLSQRTGKPVLIELNREEVFISGKTRHAGIIDLKTGVKKDGTLVAQHARLIADMGAYAIQGAVGLGHNFTFLGATFLIPNMKCDGYVVYTNNQWGGQMRGYGAPEVRFAADSQLDMIARDLGLDTAEMMLKNAVKPNQILPNGVNITSCGLTECIEKTRQGSGWKLKQSKKAGRGMGIGCHSFGSGANRPGNVSFSAMVKVHQDGGVSLLTGAIDLGQGCRSVLAQIAAEEFGVSLADIKVVTQDTDVTPPDPGTHSSRITHWTGSAVKAAAADAKEQLFKVVADSLEANPQDLVAKERRIYVKGSPARGMSIEEALSIHNRVTDGRPVLGRGYYTQPRPDFSYDTGLGEECDTYSFGAGVAEVEVDRETGQVKVLKLTAAHDCGFAINPMAVGGQIEGSAVMGIGYGILEENFQEDGQTMNPSFLAYTIPTALETPEMSPIIVETIDPKGPFGAKEAGEGTIIPIAQALANAIHDAAGVRIKNLPITPEKVLKALEEPASKKEERR